jgi:hypothetical protein
MYVCWVSVGDGEVVVVVDGGVRRLGIISRPYLTSW